jgi:hypothetical protein
VALWHQSTSTWQPLRSPQVSTRQSSGSPKDNDARPPPQGSHHDIMIPGRTRRTGTGPRIGPHLRRVPGPAGLRLPEPSRPGLGGGKTRRHPSRSWASDSESLHTPGHGGFGGWASGGLDPGAPGCGASESVCQSLGGWVGGGSATISQSGLSACGHSTCCIFRPAPAGHIGPLRLRPAIHASLLSPSFLNRLIVRSGWHTQARSGRPDRSGRALSSATGQRMPRSAERSFVLQPITTCHRLRNNREYYFIFIACY